MTKEQWLENMTSNNPDYEGLLQRLDATHDLELLKYLIDRLWWSSSGKTNTKYSNFLYTVLNDSRINFVLKHVFSNVNFAYTHSKT